MYQAPSYRHPQHSSAGPQAVIEHRGDRMGAELCLPSVRMVKGESPRRLAENWPPRDVIKKHRVKNPMPSTNILREGKQRRKEVCRVPGSLPRTAPPPVSPWGSPSAPQHKLLCLGTCGRGGQGGPCLLLQPREGASLLSLQCKTGAAPCLRPQPEPRTYNESPKMLLHEARQQTSGFRPKPPSKITATCSDGQA